MWSHLLINIALRILFLSNNNLKGQKFKWQFEKMLLWYEKTPATNLLDEDFITAS